MILHKLFHILFRPLVPMGHCPVGEGATPFWDLYDDDWECS